MPDVALDDRGRLTLPKEVRERYGCRYHVVQLPDGAKLVPIADDPLEALRDEFADAEKFEVRGDVETVVTAATYVEDHGFTPFDALHLGESNGDTIVSSDDAYEDVAPRLDPKTAGVE